MYYTIGEISKMLDIPASTLRYYDKEGLFPFVERSSGGIRMFKNEDFEWLYIIECLKKTGMPIKDIKTYIELAAAGDGTINERHKLFCERRETVKKQIDQLNATLELLDYKCWFYEQASAAGSTEAPRTMAIEEIPAAFRPVKERLSATHRPAE